MHRVGRQRRVRLGRVWRRGGDEEPGGAPRRRLPPIHTERCWRQPVNRGLALTIRTGVLLGGRLWGRRRNGRASCRRAGHRTRSHLRRAHHCRRPSRLASVQAMPELNRWDDRGKPQPPRRGPSSPDRHPRPLWPGHRVRRMADPGGQHPACTTELRRSRGRGRLAQRQPLLAYLGEPDRASRTDRRSELAPVPGRGRLLHHRSVYRTRRQSTGRPRRCEPGRARPHPLARGRSRQR